MLLPSWIGLLALGSSIRPHHREVCSFAKLFRPLPNSRGCSTASARSSGLATIAAGRRRPFAAWIRRFILFHGKRHPLEMGGPEVTRFLTSLAVEGHVAGSTQSQALSALLFLYREVLAQELPWLDDIVRAKRTAPARGADP